VRILLTTDVAGGVWTYTEELTAGLAARGHEVHLVSFGGQPRSEHRAWLAEHPEVSFTALDLPLEWMPEPEPGLTESGIELLRLADRVQPDLVHLNQFFAGALDFGAPKLVVAHSDVVSWWRAVRQEPLPDDAWFRRYRGWVTGGLDGADLRVAPSAWMAEQATAIYGCPSVRVIHNGRTAAAPDARGDRADPVPLVLTVGRLWDEGKGARDLAIAAQAVRSIATVAAAGPARHPAGGEDFPVRGAGLEWRGVLAQAELEELLRRAAIYVGTSRYEPFGLAPLEAALAGCVLVLTDIPTFRELWDGAALFYPPGDVPVLVEHLTRTLRDRERMRSFAEAARLRAHERFSADRMTTAYEILYSELTGGRPTNSTRCASR
jgi:glycogen synthase